MSTRLATVDSPTKYTITHIITHIVRTSAIPFQSPAEQIVNKNRRKMVDKGQITEDIIQQNPQLQNVQNAPTALSTNESSTSDTGTEGDELGTGTVEGDWQRYVLYLTIA